MLRMLLNLHVRTFFLALGDITGYAMLKTVAGYEGVICGGSAIYTALSQVLGK